MPNLRRRLALATLAFTLTTYSAAAQTATQQPPVGAPRPEERVVLFSASGGISKGSYQGGVDWTISEFLRRHALSEDFRRRVKLESVRFKLGSATGASAGNINAVFAALAACTDSLSGQSSPPEGGKGIQAENSLFWKAWVNTGVRELLPEKPTAYEAALDRTFFDHVHWESLLDFQRRAVATGNCDVPVGVTMTRLYPIEVSLDESSGTGSARVQRFAAVFNVVSRGQRLDIAPPAEHPGAASLGALAIPVGIYDKGEEWTTRAKAMFEAVLASSSFPVAFGPKLLTYRPGGLLPKNPITTVEAQFADGGLFDNNPLGLAAGLHELRPGALSSTRLLVYSGTENYRGDLQTAFELQALAAAKEERAVLKTGLGAAKQFASGGVSAGRQYELQLFARQRARDRVLGISGRPELFQSSRAMPIFGERLGAFGAFLGRSFRERDFYLGIYDGLEFLAQHLICNRPGIPEDDCTKTEHRRLVNENVFQLSDLAREALSWYLAQEHGERGVVHPRTDAADSPHALLLREVQRAAMTPRPDKRLCASAGDLFAEMLCNDGLDSILQTLRQSKVVRDVLPGLADQCTQADLAIGQCLVDDRFVQLMSNPRRAIYDEATRALHNLQIAEEKSPNGGFSAWLETGYSIARAATYRYQTGLQFAMSSAPKWDPHAAFASVAGKIVPGYAQWIRVAGRDSSYTLGWRPFTFPVDDEIFITSQAEWSLTDGAWKKPFSADSWSVGLSLGTFAIPKFNAFEFGAMLLTPHVSERLIPGNDFSNPTRRLIGRFALRTLTDKAQVTLLVRQDAFTFGLAINDINGSVFWWLR